MASAPYNIHSVLDKDDWNVEEIEEFLESDSSSINYVNCRKETPLLCILKKVNCTAEVVKVLLKYGADVNYKDENLLYKFRTHGTNLSTLYTALDFPGRQDIIKVLLEKGGHAYYHSPFCKAFSRGASKNVINLLRDAHCPTKCQQRMHDSVLHCALSYPKCGLNVQEVFNWGLNENVESAMCYALKCGNEASTIEMLMKNGLNLNECPEHSNNSLLCVTDVNVFNEDVVAPVLKADVVRLLIQSGGCNNTPKPDSISTPLNYALTFFKCEIEVIRLLFHCSPQSDPIERYDYLHDAVQNPHCTPTIVKFLIKEGVEVNGVDSAKKSALHSAVQGRGILSGRGVTKVSCDKSVIEALLESGADINLEAGCMCGSPFTPLCAAVLYKRGAEIFKVLLAGGAYIKHGTLDYSVDKLLNDIHNILPIKVFLKYFFLQNFFFDLEAVFRLERRHHFKDIKKFRDECKQELQKMKLKQIGEDLTLYEFISEYVSPRADSIVCELPGKKYDYGQLLKTVADYNSYPLYFDIISAKVGVPSMKRMLDQVRVYTTDPCTEKKIVLNHATVCHIARFAGVDMLRMIIAFYNPRDNPCSGQAGNEKNDHSERRAECSFVEWANRVPEIPNFLRFFGARKSLRNKIKKIKT